MQKTKSKKLSTLNQVPLREAWKHEASEFTPWLAQADNLEALADSLNLRELTCVATEHWVGDFKLDILCNDGSDQVIIENQLEETDHKHLGQIIAYAAGVGAKKVIWVAESFRPEHATALEFLNNSTTEELSFFGVKVELWRIGNSPLAPKFEVVVKPNDWAKLNRGHAKAAAESSPTKQLQLKFWMALIKKLEKSTPHIKPQAPGPRHWLSNSIGRKGFGLNVSINTTKEGRIGVELWLTTSDAKRHFAALHAKQKEIESKLKFELDWQELPEKEACRIVSWFSNAPLEDETRWDEYHEWIAQRLDKMDKVLRPIVKSLP